MGIICQAPQITTLLVILAQLEDYLTTSPPYSPSPSKERGKIGLKGLCPFKLPVITILPLE
jgi:hypothetical protein